MILDEKKIIYDEVFSTTKSDDNTLKINNTSDVATNKHYYPIGKLQKDENYIFDSRYNPMYCTQSYDGCNQCVSSCVACAGGCQTSCQETCYNGCVSGCTASCQTCHGGCNSGCQTNCTDSCHGVL